MIRKKRNRRSGGFLEAFLGTSIIAWAFYVLALLLPGCGGGSGGDGPMLSVILDAQLNGDQEYPPVVTEATGEGLFTVHPDDNRLEYHLEFRGLTSDQTGAHIHGPAGHGENAPILFHLELGSPASGTVRYTEDLESAILGGRVYVNVHSDEYPAGEIRGQLIRRPDQVYEILPEGNR